MTKTRLILFVFLITIGLTLGWLLFQNQKGIAMAFHDISNMVGPTLERMQNFFSPVIAFWNSLPSTVKGIVTVGIPSLFAMFFAWTKNRAMQSLQQTEAQVTEISGKLTESQSSTISAMQKNEELQQKLNVYEATGSAVEQFKSINEKLEADKRILEAQVKQLTTERDMAQNKIKEWEGQFILEKKIE